MTTTLTDRLGGGATVAGPGSDLEALEALSGTGIAVRVANANWATRTLIGPAAGITFTFGDGTGGNPTVALANDLAGLEGIAGTGLAARTATDAWAARTITGTANKITVTDGNGVAGNPTLTVGTDIRQSGKETIWIPAGSMASRSTNGAAAGSVEMTTNKNMFVTKDFDTATQEFVQFEIWFPKSWNLGTLSFQPVWSHAATVTNFGVVWGLAAVARSDDDAGDVAFGTAVTSADVGGTTNDLYLGPDSGALTVAGSPAVGDVVQFQLNRTVADGGDTLGIDARLHGIRLFFTTNAANDA